MTDTSLHRRAGEGWKHALSLLVSAGLLLLPAFINGYPLVNSDDGTYLHSGFIPEMPRDRPIAYGLLLNIFSLNGLTLWIALAVQAVCTAWLIGRTVRRTVGGGSVRAFAIVALLAVTTSLSWIASEIIPDICTPMTLLIAWLLLNGEESRRTRLWLLILYLLMVATHLSHVMIFGLLVGAALLFRKWWMPRHARNRAPRTVLAMAVLTLVALATMLRPIGVSNHVFTMAALLDGGMLKPYLDEACPTKNYRLCKYKDSLNPNPNYFLWEGGSPVQTEGGWAAVKPEYDRIIADIHARPKYVWMRAQASVRFTLRQAAAFTVGDGNWNFGEGSRVHLAVRQYVPSDERGYLAAWQHTYPGNIEDALRPLNRYLYAVVILSALALAGILLFYRKKLGSTLRFFVLFAVAGTLLNFWNCATFSQVNGRYGARMVWLVPFCALLCVVALWQQRQKKKRVRLSA